MAPRRRRDTEVSAITDISLDDDESRGRSVSLYGLSLSLRAMKITRRLSVSSYLKAGLEPTTKPPTVQYENTYKVKPDEGTSFKYSRIQPVMMRILEKNLATRRYNPVECKRLCSAVSSGILACVKDMDMPRYKFVCNVTIGQKLGQGMTTASRCLWNTESDDYVSVTYENTSLYAVASLYGVYFE